MRTPLRRGQPNVAAHERRAAERKLARMTQGKIAPQSSAGPAGEPENAVRRSLSIAAPLLSSAPASGAKSRPGHTLRETRGSPADEKPTRRRLSKAAHQVGSAATGGFHIQESDGRVAFDTQPQHAVAKSARGRQSTDVNQRPGATASGPETPELGRGRIVPVDPRPPLATAAKTKTKTKAKKAEKTVKFVQDNSPTTNELIEMWKRRQAWHRAEKSLILQAKAICRRYTGGDKALANELFAAATAGRLKGQEMNVAVAIFPLIEAIKQIEPNRLAIEKHLTKLAKTYPVWEWAEGVRGFGALSLASIIGEAGDLTNYANPAKLWKRMGLAVMPDGTRQRRVTGVDALEHGFVPARRSVMWVIGDCIVKSGKPGDSNEKTYRDIYDARKLYELPRCQAMEEEKLKKGNYSPKAHAPERLICAAVCRRTLYAE